MTAEGGRLPCAERRANVWPWGPGGVPRMRCGDRPPPFSSAAGSATASIDFREAFAAVWGAPRSPLSPEARALHRRIWELQHPEDCRTARLLVFHQWDNDNAFGRSSECSATRCTLPCG